MKTKWFILAILLGWTIFGFAQKPDLDYPTDTIEGVIVYRYPVDRSIGIYRISVNFGVSQAMVIEWNPFLKDRGLQFGDTLYIPSGRTVIKNEELNRPEGLNEELKNDTIDSIVGHTVLPPLEGATNMALLLPLQAQITPRTETMDRFVDFYEGCLIALQQIQDSLFPIHLFVYDTGKDLHTIEQLIQDGKLDSMKAIIGPAYPQQVTALDSFVNYHHIPTLVPFTDNVPMLSHNPYLIRFNATAEQEADAFLQFVESKQDSVNCVLVEGREADIPQNIRYIREQIINCGLPYTITSLHTIMADSLYTNLKDSVRNIIIFNTEKYNNLQIILPHLLMGKGKNDLALYSRYAWQKEQIVLSQIYATIFATDSAASIGEYEQAYDMYFGHSHASDYPRFDLLGYDLTRQFIAFLRGRVMPQGLQSDLRLERVGEGGLMNTYMTLINQ